MLECANCPHVTKYACSLPAALRTSRSMIIAIADMTALTRTAQQAQACTSHKCTDGMVSDTRSCSKLLPDRSLDVEPLRGVSRRAITDRQALISCSSNDQRQQHNFLTANALNVNDQLAVHHRSFTAWQPPLQALLASSSAMASCRIDSPSARPPLASAPASAPAEALSSSRKDTCMAASLWVTASTMLTH